MREIKFRAWDTVNKMWLKITGFETYNSDDGKTASINTGIAGMFHDGDYIGTFQKHAGEQNNVILVQYTGLKDVDGQEIYEGDIVRLCYNGFYNNAEVFTGEVIFEEGSFEVKAKGEYTCLHDGVGLTTSEVIGNIYENPELLEGK